MFIDKYSKRYGVNWLLSKLNVCPNAYYNYRKHRKSARQREKASVLKVIEKIYHDAGGRPGYRMMQQLLANKGISLSVQTVRKYMNVELGLKSVTRKARYHYVKGSGAYETAEDLVRREFRAAHQNEVWCIDFTYLHLADHRVRYNCSIIDLFDRRIVSSVNGNRIDPEQFYSGMTYWGC